MPNPQTTISSQSREKLKAFQFEPHEHENRNKENTVIEQVLRKDLAPAIAEKRIGTQPASMQEMGTCPRTPGARIPLSDLIANPEDSLNRPLNATPLDQVEWKNGPGSSEPSCSAKSAQRRRKRARSSSPTSQSQIERSRHFGADKEALDLESIGRSLRTPKQEDPLSILWANYAGNRIPEEGNDSLLPPLPPMSSSPNTPAALNKDGFRRTASCGIEWPTTSAKKRKLSDRDSYSRAKGIFAAKRDAILAKNATNQSRVGILVDSIHQSLINKAASETKAMSSSSPLPERYGESRCSPVKRAAPLNTIMEQVENDTFVTKVRDPTPVQDGSSDFGDMDLDPDDPDLLSAILAATQNPVAPPAAKNANQVNYKPYPTTGTKTMPSESPSVVAHVGLTEAPTTEKADQANVESVTRQFDAKDKKDPDRSGSSDFNSFDDDEDFAAELGELADKVDSQSIANLDGSHEKNLIQKVSKPPEVITIDDQDDEFDDDDDDINDVWDAVDKVTSHGLSQFTGSKMNQDNRTIKRYLVKEVFDQMFVNPKGRQQPEKVLSLKDEKLQFMYSVHLRQSWYDTRCTKGSYIHLIGEFDRQGSCVVDDNNNMVILHPDHLISATTVADSFSCTRRATLQDRVKATSPAQPPQVYGHLIHEVFGEALRLNQWDAQSLRQIVLKLIPTYIESLYEINTQIHDAVEYVMSRMPELTAWAGIFVTAKLDPEATIRDRNGAVIPMAIDKLLELEEHVWSPMYGLKGNIDATVQAQMQFPGERFSRTLTVPFELKTGKGDSSEMHRAQTALYTLLVSDRYDINVTSGILYYLETSKTFRVEGIRNEIRQMIIQRNELACYVHDKLDLPPMIKKEHLCKRCFAQTACFAYHKLIEGGDGETSGMKGVFTDAVGHLKGPQQAFFKKWDDLLTKEERDTMKFKRELWTMLSTERETVGRCFANVVIEPGSAVESVDAPKVNRYTYSFLKHRARPGFSFTESQITVGEPIVISDEKGHFALAIGFVTMVRPNRITVAVDRRLQNVRSRQSGFDSTNNQVFSAIMEVSKEVATSTAQNTDPDHPTLYRIDKDEFATGMATARNNVLRIMEKDLWRARELRQLIVDGKAPLFKQIATAYSLSGPASQQNINIDQRKAIEKVMSAKDYALVLGMPGTGKTTTIAHIIRALVAQGKSVLLTSYTHTAVDNILLKIKDDKIPILRLGAIGKVHPDIANFADLSGIPKKSIEELEASWTRSKIVATTCLGINHPIFNHRKFDYCIVDEASQITLPVCLGPIRLASTFILVGDHFQLPPLVQNKEAQEGGLDVSLFKLLSDAQPSSVVNLEHQYRMAEDIMVLSNVLIYNGRLKCGTPAIASRTLHIPSLSTGMEAHHYSSSNLPKTAQSINICILNSASCWISYTLNPKHRMLFLDTDTMSSTSTLGAPETIAGHGTRITNQTEASLIAQLLTALIRSGVPPKSIGVITFYRSQLALLRSTVKSLAGTSATNDLEMHTADKYQGRDKEVILLSCVRSNDSQHVGELLKDWRRVNVALTRAKSKLIVLGSLSTLGGSRVPVLEGLSKIVRERRWVYDLPIGALDMHYFEGMATQTQVSVVSSKSWKTRTDANGRQALATINGNAKPNMKQPVKVFKGGVNVEKFLDRHPLIQDLALDEFGTVAII